MQLKKSEYIIRNLNYSLPGLIGVSAMLIIASSMTGLICNDLVPVLNPLLPDRVGASPGAIGIVPGTIPVIMNFELCPWISTAGNRSRTGIGRRMPCLFFSAPLMVPVMQLPARHREIAGAIMKFLPIPPQVNMVFRILTAVIFIYLMAFLFPGSVLSCPAVDIIPQKVPGRCFAAAAKGNGMTAGQYGKVIGIGSLCAGAVVLIFGKYVDKYNPMFICFFSGKVTAAFGYRVMFIRDIFITAATMATLAGAYFEWKKTIGGKNR